MASDSAAFATPPSAAPGRLTAFRLVQGVHYLALGTWFGATLMMGLAAGLTFATVRSHPLVLTEGPASTPPLAERAQDFLAGNVVTAAFDAFTVIQLVCGGLLLVTLIAQLTTFRGWLRRAGRTWPNALRVACIAVGLALFASDLALNRPFMAMAREEMYYHGPVSVEALADLEASFDRLHQRSSRSMGVAALLMAAAALVSPFAFTSGPPAREEPLHG